MSQSFKSASVLLTLFASLSAHAESVVPISDPSISESSLLDLLAGPGITIDPASVSYTAQDGDASVSIQAGVFAGFSNLPGTLPQAFDAEFDQGVILSTGDVRTVVGPNDAENTTTAHIPGDNPTAVTDPYLGPDLFDPVTLKFTVEPQNEVLVLDFVFGSEEYAEYVGDNFNDLAQILVGSSGGSLTNCALTPAGDDVRINNINAGSANNSGLYLDNPLSAPAYNLEMDGLTRRMSCRVPVTPGNAYDVVIGIADVYDAQWDSWIFFRADSMRSEPLADFGDAPDSYGTLSASGGASHVVVDGVYLGAPGVTGDLDGFVDGIDGSQGLASDDSDNALSVVPVLTPGASSYAVSFDATSINGLGSTVVGWVDFDRDGQFQADEAAPLVNVTAGSYETPVTLTWSDLGGAGPDVNAGPTYMRLRIANVGPSSTATGGEMMSGEVEDYRVIISDGAAPVLLSLLRQAPTDALTNASEVTFRLTFSEFIDGLDATDLTVSVGTITSLTRVSDTEFNVIVGTPADFDGTLSLTVNAVNDLVDAEGNALSSTTPTGSNESYTVDTLVPATPVLSAVTDDTGVSSNDFITQDTSLIFTGSAEAGTQVRVFIAGNPADPVVADVNGNWTLDISGFGFPESTVSLTVQATDTAGNVSAMSAPQDLTVDTTAPATPGIVSISEDTGASNVDGITNDNALVIMGTADANQNVVVFIDGVAQGTVAAGPTGVWTYDNSANALTDGSYVITATASDDAGNTSVSSPYPVIIDSSAPVAPALTSVSTDSGVAGDGITNDNGLTFNGTAAADDAVDVLLDGSVIGTATANASGDWSYDYSGAELVDGDYVLTARVTDTAGNAADSADFALTVDSTAPAAPAIAGISDDSGASTTDGVTADAELIISGSAEPDTQIEIFVNGSSVGTTTANGSGDWSFDNSGNPLVDGTYAITAQASDIAGNSSASSTTFDLVVDGTDPLAPTITAISPDTGAAGDGVTADPALTVSGNGEPGAQVELFNGGSSAGIAIVDAAGQWSVDFSGAPLADGDYTLTAVVTDLAGNGSPVSGGFDITVDASVPVAPVIAAISNDTGAATDDGITSDSGLTISGSAEPGASVEVFIGGNSVGTAIADGSGAWSYDNNSSSLADGNYAITAIVTDEAGNSSPVSSPLNVTIDSQAPAQAVVTSITPDSGTAGDGITNEGALIIRGTAEPGADVDVLRGGVVIDTVTADESGNWTLDDTATTLADGEYEITAMARDVAGNEGDLSEVLAVTIDSSAPVAPAVTTISDDTGTAGDGVTSDPELLISGSAEAFASVNVFINGSAIGSATANSDGDWTYDNRANTLVDGVYTITAVATDSAGNVSPASEDYSLTIDTSGPITPAIGGISDNTGSAAGQTSDQTLIISGTADAGSTVTVFIDGVAVGSATSDSEGNWSVDNTDESLAEGSYAITAQAEAPSGLLSALSAPFNVTVDTSDPAAPLVTAVSDDTGIAGDGVTSDSELVISGTAEPGVDIIVYLDGSLMGSAQASGDGEWSLNYDSVSLADGSYGITAMAVDAAANSSLQSGEFALTIDSQDPSVPVLAGISPDNGVSSTDLITDTGALVFSGSAEAGSDISVLVNGASIGTATADESGNWAVDVTATPLAEGSYDLVVRSADLAGNTAETAAEALVIDTTAPVTGTVTAIAPDTATPGDAVTATPELSISGVAEPGSSVQVLVNGAPAGAAVADGNGDWTFDNTGTTLPDGNYAITTLVTDPAGNSSLESPAFEMTVDATAPDAPVVTDISDDTGAQSDDGVTSDTTLVIAGTTEPDADVIVYLDGALIGNAQADGSGNWAFSYESTPLTEGAYTLTATATDIAGNTSVASFDFDIIIDETDPGAVTLAEDGETIADNTPTLSGTADAGSLITVTIDGNDYTTTTDDAGNWTLDVTADVANGTYSVTVVSADDAGNESTVSGSIEIDVSVSATNSTTSASPLTIPSDGTTPSVITVEVRDTANDPVTGILPVITTDLGELTAVADQGNGVYTAELTSQFETGTATVEIAIAGTALAPINVTVTPADVDGDGLTDLDEDNNGDGDASNDDLDRDGTPDYLDPDDDGDGKNTTEEDVNGNGDPRDDDSDEDGIPDYLDRDDDSSDGTNDSDEDGVPDDVECTAGIPCEDSDGDGIPDYMDEDDDNDGAPTAAEGAPNRDSDGDGTPDFRDNDDDDDGILTADEDANLDGDDNPATNPGPDDDADGIPAYLDPNDNDTASPGDGDGDGIPDDQECLSGIPCEDSDGDGIPDYRDDDDDGDGVPTADEGAPLRDTNGDGTPDYLDDDDDGDGIRTPDEDGNTDGDFNPATTAGPDADNDGIPAYLDINDGEPGPGDGDGDGIPDDQECSALPCEDSDGDGIPDYRDDDDDGDGVQTSEEGAGTPSRDSDGDGTPDYLDDDDDGDGIRTPDEDANADLDGNPATNPGPDADNDGIPAYLDINDGEPGTGDGDEDGIPDDVECPTGLPCVDTDGDGIPDYRDDDDDGDGVPTADEGAPVRDTDGDDIPDYLDDDDDNDGIRTPDEDANTDLDGNPATNPGPDADNDGIPAYLDINDGEPGPGDGDGDGIPDDQECSALPCTDIDGDGIPDFRDDDDDGDGIRTAEEDDNSDGDGNPATNPGPDGDNDGTPDYLDPDGNDDDRDGLTNLDEDGNGDGDPTNDDLDRDGTPDYLDPDDDGDGRTTQEEDLNGNGDPRDDDADNDGIPAYLDPNDEFSGSPGDGDGDGIPDDIECPSGVPCRDSDSDGTPDYMDEDDDNDGIPSTNEMSDRDTDNDGLPDYRDPDDDGDGISTEDEDGDSDGDGNPYTVAGPDDDNDRIPAYLDPNDSDISGPGDSDDDGISDALECLSGAPCADSDNDGRPDYNDPDDDNDGRLTSTEDPNADGDATNDDTDGDGTPDYLDRDDDGDGIVTGDEGDDDGDNDGIPDYLDRDDASLTGTGGDSDEDGISDLAECPTGLPCRDSDGDGRPDYNDPDDDNDGLTTLFEGPVRDTDGDGVPDYRDPDDDDDGFSTLDEGTGDSDDDGIPDYLDPSAGDSDEDGVPDGAECPEGVPCRDTDGDGVPDYLDRDDDNDGIPTASEDPDFDGNPAGDDTDGDGIPDYLDRDDDGDGVLTSEEPSGDTDNDGIPDFRDGDNGNTAGMPDGSGDSDDDGLSDLRECAGGEPCVDTDDDGVADYLDPDDDGDGILTVGEDRNQNGDPTDDDTDSDGIPDYQDRDDDGDGLSTLEEGTGDGDGDRIPDYLDPTGNDDDNDGITNAIECPIICWDTDNDGTPNFRDEDDDGDGVPTIEEDANGDGNPRNDDTDGNGIPDYLDPDDDGDGISTALEGGFEDDADGDGIPDFRDRDSSNRSGTGDGSGDSDEDGLSDAEECGGASVCRDSDGDGQPDYMQAGTGNLAPVNPGETADGKQVSAGISSVGSMNWVWLLLALPLVRRRNLGAALLALLPFLQTQALEAGADVDAAAEDSVWDDVYVGAGGQYSRLTPGTVGSIWSNDDETGLGWSVMAGYRVSGQVALELQYNDLGAADLVSEGGQQAAFGYSTYGGFIHWYPWQTSWKKKGHLNAYLELGAVALATDSEIDYQQQSSASMALGVGVEYTFMERWAARLSAQSFSRDAQTIGFSIMKRFGSETTTPVTRKVVDVPAPDEIYMPVVAPVVVIIDSDNDGIVDDIDDCPGTPPGIAVDHRGCTMLDARLDGVYFASGSAQLTPGSKTKLLKVVDILNDYPSARVEIGAHTDSLGSERANYDLSEARAIEVMEYLVFLGVDPGRLEAKGYGETQPIADNSTSTGRAKNRRVEVRMID